MTIGENQIIEGAKSLKVVPYNTRDGNGNEITVNVKIKQFPIYNVDFQCPICKRRSQKGCKAKDITSSNFTDWTYMGEYICPDCSELFSLYFYSYVVDPDGIHIYNVRELQGQLVRRQKPPFLFCITTTRKKHLFYRAVQNYDSNHFAVNLETETIWTTPERMEELFTFVECLQTLGCTKERMSMGEISFPVMQKVSKRVFKYLHHELLSSREIQIPLYCGQKRDISEEEAICYINSILRI